MSIGIFEGTSHSVTRKVTLDSMTFNQIDEANPTLTNAPVGPTGSPYAIRRNWVLMQGTTLRTGAELALLCKFDRSLSADAQFDKKYVAFDPDSGCKLTYTPTQITNSGQNSYLAVQVLQAAFDPSNVNYNTTPSRVDVRQTFVSQLITGTEVSVAPGVWYDIGPTQSLRNAINNGICFTIDASDPAPKASADTMWSTLVYLSLSSVKLTLVVSDFKLGFSSLSPDHDAYVQPNAPVTVAWAVDVPTEGYFSTAPVQASFEIQYYTKSGGTTSATKTLTGTTATSAAIPAVDMADAESLSWRMRVTSDDGIVGNWSDWRTCTCVNKSGKATAISPDGASVTPEESIVFLWEHSSVSGRPQAAAQIQVKYAGDADYTTVYSGQTTQRRAAVILTLTAPKAGQAAWRVRTQDDLGAWSAWSDPLYVYIVAASSAPSVTSVTEGTAKPTVSWQSGSQTGYRVIIRTTGGADVYDTGVLPGSGQSHTVGSYLPDGQYIAAVRVWNEYAIESAEGTRAFTVDTASAAPVPGAITAAPRNGHVLIVIRTQPAALRLVILRDGVPIAALPSGATRFLDYGAGSGTHSYVLRAETENAFSGSAAVSAAPVIDCASLAPADALDEWLALRMSRDSAANHADDLAIDAVQRGFAGRELPVVEFSGRRDHIHRHSFALLEREQMRRLLDMLLAEAPLLYRDQYGRRYFCVCTALPVTYDAFSESFTLELMEVDYKEALE